jgi:hypothetical protein
MAWNLGLIYVTAESRNLANYQARALFPDSRVLQIAAMAVMAQEPQLRDELTNIL